MRIRWNLVALASLVIGAWALLPVAAAEKGALQLARGGEMFEIFQFPRDQMPRIDGKTEDWDMVPERYTYGTDLLNDTEDGHGTDIDPKDLDVKVTVGWVKGLNRLYVLYEAYDLGLRKIQPQELSQ